MTDRADAVVAQWKKERPDLDTWPMEITIRVYRLSQLLGRGIKSFLAEHGLESGEFDVLLTLRRAGEPFELTAGALQDAAMVTSGAITNRIDRMMTKGLVERNRVDDGDRRTVLVRLTPQGKRLVDELVDKHVANQATMLAGLPADQRDEFAALLRDALEALGDTPGRK